MQAGASDSSGTGGSLGSPANGGEGVVKTRPRPCGGACGTWVVHVVLIFVQLSFSGWHVVGQLALDKGVNPLIFATYRELTAAAMMFLTAMMATHTCKFLWKIESQDLLRFSLCGFLSFANVVGFIVALKFTSASRAASLQPSIPIWGMLLSVIVGIEIVTVWKVLGVLCATGGSLIVALADSSGGAGKRPTLGTAILLFQCASVGGLLVFNKPLVKKYSYAVVTFTYYTIGMVITIFCSLYYVNQQNVWRVTKSSVWGALAYAAVFATLFTYSATTWSNKFLDPSVISLYSTCQPVFTTILSVSFLHSHVVPQEAIGGAAIILGLLITLYARKLQRDKEKAQEEEREKLLDGSNNDSNDPVEPNNITKNTNNTTASINNNDPAYKA